MKKNKFAELLYNWLDKSSKKPSKLLHDRAVREALLTLEPSGDAKARQKEYVIKKLSLFLMIMAVGLVLSIALLIKEGTQTEIVGNQIERNAYGDGEKSVSLVAKGEADTYEISLSVDEKLYTQEELYALLEEFTPLLEAQAAGQNASFDRVEYDLELVKSLSGYPFKVEWRTDGKYIDSGGALINSTLDEPALTTITAVISCEGFEAEHELSCMVYSKAVQPSRSELIAQTLEAAQGETREEEFITLPSQVGAEKISWSYPKSYMGLVFLIATPLLAVLIYFSTDKDLKKQVEERNEQMRLDYPEIVSSLALLIGAGMTVPNAWRRVAKDYRVKKQETGIRRYAYEEMLIAIYEMDSGIAQTSAYERFGRRCRVQSYNRLASMLSQNVRKGASNLAVLLREEAAYAFEERKHTARRLGEKAGTKLLMPMMMLLGMIMVVIMVPAFKNYF